MKKLDFPQMLRKIIAAGYTQARIAKETGIRQGSISRYSTGARRPGTPEHVLKIIGLHEKVSGARRG